MILSRTMSASARSWFGSRWFTALALGGLLVAGQPLPAHAGAQLITDGTFQTSSLTAGGFICQNGSGVGSTCTSNLTSGSGASLVTTWNATCSPSSCVGTATPGSILFGGPTNVVTSTFNGGFGLAGTVVDPPGGGNILAVDGDPTYSQTISQTVSGLSVGDRYQLTFYQGAAQQSGLNGATTEQWKVTFGSSGSQTSQVMNNASQGVVPWQTVTMNFIATSTSEVLSFLSLGTPAGMPPVVLLADVSLYDIPEPSTIAVFGIGTLALLRFRGKRARA